MTDKHFRGGWSPQLSVPVKQKFLPTPPPQGPKPKKEEPLPEPVVVPPPAKEKLKKPPPEALAPGCVNINDRSSSLF